MQALFRNKIFVLDEMIQRNASHFFSFMLKRKKEEENQDYKLICTYIFIYEVYFIHFIYNTCNFECLFMFSLLHYAHIYLYC